MNIKVISNAKSVQAAAKYLIECSDLFEPFNYGENLISDVNDRKAIYDSPEKYIDEQIILKERINEIRLEKCLKQINAARAKSS